MMGDHMSEINWWGEYVIPYGKTGCWHVGPLSLWIQRLEGEWRLAYRDGPDPLDTSLGVELPCDDLDLSGLENYTRFVFGSSSERLRLSVMLADRPVVTRPENPLYVPPDEEVTVYVSSPLWIHIETENPAKTLLEIPIYRPSDTWFGPNTLEGELCYSSKTFHRVQLDQVPVRPHRATTAVLVQNHAGTMLSMDRMQVPVPHLALYQSQNGRLWTDDVIFTRTGTDDFASLRTRAKGGRRMREKAVRIAEPRKKPGENIVVRAFSSLFG